MPRERVTEGEREEKKLGEREAQKHPETKTGTGDPETEAKGLVSPGKGTAIRGGLWRQ